MDLGVDAREVGGVRDERVRVQQDDRARLGGRVAQHLAQQRRVGPVQVQVIVPEAGVELHRHTARRREPHSRPHRVRDEDRIVEALSLRGSVNASERPRHRPSRWRRQLEADAIGGDALEPDRPARQRTFQALGELHGELRDANRSGRA